MKIIEDWNEAMNQRENLLVDGKIKIPRFAILGELHEGHIEVIKLIKEKYGSVAVSFNELMLYIKSVLNNEIYMFTHYDTIESIKNSIEKVKNHVDYLYIFKLDDYPQYIIKDETNKALSNFNNWKDKLKEIGFNRSMVLETIFLSVYTPLWGYTKGLIGPKMLLQWIVFYNLSNIYEKGYDIFDDVIFKFVYSNDDNTIVKSRSGSDKKLSDTKNTIAKKIEKNKSISYNNIISILEQNNFSEDNVFIIDIKNIKRIYNITKNCCIFLRYLGKTEYIFIIDGNMIY